MRLRTKEFLVIIVLFLLVGGFAYYYHNLKEKNRENEVCFEDNCFNVEIVADYASRARGLMFRENLSENSGMLFIFEQEGIYPFWMKDTLIPLDMIWISEEKKIVFIARDVQPCKTQTCQIISPNKEGIGSARRCDFKDGKFVEERVTAFKPNKSISFELYKHQWPLVFMRWTNRLEKHGENTLLVSDTEYELKFGIAGKIMNMVIMRRKFSQIIDDALGKLKRYTETGAAAS